MIDGTLNLAPSIYLPLNTFHRLLPLCKRVKLISLIPNTDPDTNP